MTNEATPQPEATEAQPPRRRRPMRRVTVTRVQQLSPRMVRVTFTGEDLQAFGWNGPAAHIKLGFPEAGQADIALPEPDGPRPTMRTYTPRRFDASVPELDVDFVLHGDGPAASWATQAQPGQALIVAGPGPNYQVDPDADWFLLAGDDTALPAIETILDALPADINARVLIEVADAQEERPLASAAQINVTWLHHDGNATQADRPLEAALRASDLPRGNGRIYVGCEAAAMRRIRAHLIQERGLDPARLVTRGYWKLGDINYTDHDYGTDS